MQLASIVPKDNTATLQVISQTLVQLSEWMEQLGSHIVLPEKPIPAPRNGWRQHSSAECQSSSISREDCAGRPAYVEK